MSLTPSTMLDLGTPLPKFELPIVNNQNLQNDFSSAGLRKISSAKLPQKPVLIMILCAHCPFVKHVEEQLTAIQGDYENSVVMLAVSSNSISTHPQDAPKHLSEQAALNNWTFPYLFDSDQTLAKSLKAACTPDFFLFSPSPAGEQKLRYRGQIDSSRPGNQLECSGIDLRNALDSVLGGKLVEPDQKPSIGCNIKWHPGKEPAWFG